jgi:V8-like Glu-specific endopeptidase
VDGYRAPGVFAPVQAMEQQATLAAWLLEEQASQVGVNAIEAPASSTQLAELRRQADEALRAMLVGVTVPTDALIDLDDLAYGALRMTKSMRVWTGTVRSAGASALRIHFTDFQLPHGAELYVYNDSGVAFGPYTGTGPLGSGEFWSNTVVGDTALVQLRGVDADTYFTIADVGHLGPDFRYADYHITRGTEKSLCYNEDCVENAGCGTSSAVNTAEDAIAHYTYVKRPWIYMCSGGLIADQAQSGTPYFLTANHCVSRDREAGSVETFFFYTANCGDCASPGSAHTVGATVEATNSTADYTLLRLNGSAPAGSAFLGWTTDAVAYTNNYGLYRISHPQGAPQAYSEHKVDPSAGTCSSWPRGSWIYSRDTYGATDGGSSGSPVVNSSGLVVGQLSGGCGTNVYDVCDNVSNATVDGAFASYYDEVAGILGGGTPCQDADGDGYDDAACGGSDCDDGDYFVNPGVDEVCGDSIDNNCDGNIDEGCTSCPDADGDGYDDEACGGTDCDDGDFFVNPGVDEVCDDSIDNNCDGNIDEGCGSCVPAGEYCTSGSECCSGRCHPAKNYCR